MSKETYTAKGYMFFVMTSTEDFYGYDVLVRSREDMINHFLKVSGDRESAEEWVDEKELTHRCYDIIDGEKFLEDVLNYSFIDYDGEINAIYVDGYKSNLGLCAGNLMSGDFMVNEYLFREICKEHKVEVDWANR